MPIELTFVPKLAKKARLRFDRHSNRYMLVYPERGLELNESAAAIAKRCDGTRTVAQIIDELVREYAAFGDERDHLTKDVLGLLELLARKGLIEA